MAHSLGTGSTRTTTSNGARARSTAKKPQRGNSRPRPDPPPSHRPASKACSRFTPTTSGSSRKTASARPGAPTKRSPPSAHRSSPRSPRRTSPPRAPISMPSSTPMVSDVEYHFEYGTTPVRHERPGSRCHPARWARQPVGRYPHHRVERRRLPLPRRRQQRLRGIESADQTFNFYPPVCPNSASVSRPVPTPFPTAAPMSSSRPKTRATRSSSRPPSPPARRPPPPRGWSTAGHSD